VKKEMKKNQLGGCQVSKQKNKKNLTLDYEGPSGHQVFFFPYAVRGIGWPPKCNAKKKKNITNYLILPSLRRGELGNHIIVSIRIAYRK
jgi:hypothetical protein